MSLISIKSDTLNVKFISSSNKHGGTRFSINLHVLEREKSNEVGVGGVGVGGCLPWSDEEREIGESRRSERYEKISSTLKCLGAVLLRRSFVASKTASFWRLFCNVASFYTWWRYRFRIEINHVRNGFRNQVLGLGPDFIFLISCLFWLFSVYASNFKKRPFYI